MEITYIRVHPVSGMPRLKGYATIVLNGELAINEIRIIQSQHGMCIAFPKDHISKKINSESIVPLNREIRGYIESTVLKAYNNYLLQEA